MKSKLKAPEIAKKKGMAHVKNTLKKYLKEDIIEPLSFFYDSEFDYGGVEGKMPLMYIGEVPTLWKKYVKENKTSKTLAAGRCVFQDGTLLLEVKIGKGDKNPILKDVYKMLLKPFAKVKFVDSVEAPTAVATSASPENGSTEENSTDDTALDTSTMEQLIAEAKELAAEATEKISVLKKYSDELGPVVKDMGAKPVTDDIIKKAIDSLVAVHALEVDNWLEASTLWTKNISSKEAADKDLAAAMKDLNKLHAELKAADVVMDEVAKGCEKLEKVQNPQDSKVPPVDTDAGTMLKNTFSRISQDTKEFTNKANDMFKEFNA
jgi:hypothetical protein